MTGVPEQEDGGEDIFFFSSRRRHTRWTGDWSSTCALPIFREASTQNVNSSDRFWKTVKHVARSFLRRGIQALQFQEEISGELGSPTPGSKIMEAAQREQAGEKSCGSPAHKPVRNTAKHLSDKDRQSKAAEMQDSRIHQAGVYQHERMCRQDRQQDPRERKKNPLPLHSSQLRTQCRHQKDRCRCCSDDADSADGWLKPVVTQQHLRGGANKQPFECSRPYIKGDRTPAWICVSTYPTQNEPTVSKQTNG